MKFIEIEISNFLFEVILSIFRNCNPRGYLSAIKSTKILVSNIAFEQIFSNSFYQKAIEFHT
jgi:hypothetical protein